MEKVVRDGKVAVLISPEFGSGWYSANDDIEACLFHPKIVEMVEAGQQGAITEELCIELFDVRRFDVHGAEGLEIDWIPEGTEFKVQEFDGAETLRFRDSPGWIKA